MASILENSLDHASDTEPAAVIDVAEFEKASRDPRVRDFLAEADRYLDEIELAGRDR